jgi:hypothetical protein
VPSSVIGDGLSARTRTTPDGSRSVPFTARVLHLPTALWR